MDYNEYQKGCLQTSAHPTDYAPRFLSEANSRLAHCAFGLASEIGELQIAHDNINELEELGDFCWYLSEGATALGVDFGAIINHIRGLEELLPLSVSISNFVDIVKKRIFYGKEINGEELFDRLVDVAGSITNECFRRNLNFDEVLEANQEKLLKKRYASGKFTAEEALNRDLVAEREALES